MSRSAEVSKGLSVRQSQGANTVELPGDATITSDMLAGNIAGTKIQPATASQWGVVTTVAQIFAGNKTFTGSVVVQADFTAETTGTAIHTLRSTNAIAEIRVQSGGASFGAYTVYRRGTTSYGEVGTDATMTGLYFGTYNPSFAYVGAISLAGAWTFGTSGVTSNNHVVYGRMLFNRTTTAPTAISIDLLTTDYIVALNDVGATTQSTLRIGGDGGQGAHIVARTQAGVAGRGLALYAMVDDTTNNGDMIFDTREQDNSGFTTLTNDAFRFRSNGGANIMTASRGGVWSIGSTSAAATIDHNLYGHLHIGTSAATVVPNSTSVRIVGNKKTSIVFSDAGSGGVSEFMSGVYTTNASGYLNAFAGIGGSKLLCSIHNADSDVVFDFKSSSRPVSADSSVTFTTIGQATAGGAWSFGPSTGGALTHLFNSGTDTTVRINAQTGSNPALQLSENNTTQWTILNINTSDALWFNNASGLTNLEITQSASFIFGRSSVNNQHLMHGDLVFSGATGNDINIRTNTSDASDNKRVLISSGGAAGPARGAYVEMHGNEFASTPGRILFEAGTAATGANIAWLVNVGATSFQGHMVRGSGSNEFASDSAPTSLDHVFRSGGTTGVRVDGNSSTGGQANLFVDAKTGAANYASVQFATGGSVRWAFFTGQTYTGTASLSADELGLIRSGGTLYAKWSTSGAYQVLANVNDWALFARNANASPYGTLIQFTAAAPNNTTNLFLECTDTGATRMQVRSNGGIANFQANDVNLSDERIKSNIVSASSQLAFIRSLQIKEFEYTDSPGNVTVGLIAQDVEALDANLISEAGQYTIDGVTFNAKAIKTTDIYHRMIKAFQELADQKDAEIAALTARIEALENN